MSNLIVENIKHSYENDPVLHDISFTASSGSISCVLGASGSGKTTVLRLIGGFERLHYGRITIHNRIMADAVENIYIPPERREIGMMFQDYALFPHLTVEQNLLFGLTKNNHKRKTWVLEAAERLGIGKLLHKYSFELSGGEQQRVALLRAIAPQPKILLLDEPFSGLDPHLRRQIRDEVISFIRSINVTTMVVTHDPEEAHYMADQLLILDEGKLIQKGPPTDVRKKPASPTVASFFGATNHFELKMKEGQKQINLPILREPIAIHNPQNKVILQCYPEDILIKEGANFTLVERFMVEYGGERLIYKHNETGQKYIAYSPICSRLLGQQANLEINPQHILLFND